MYAKELFISGTKEDFAAAAPWFEKRLTQPELTADARTETVCVLAKHASLQKKQEELLSLALSELSVNQAPAAELFYLLGEYYEASGKEAEAAAWYKKAALEAECYVCISYGGEQALRQAIRLLKRLGCEEQAAQYENMLG